MIHSLLPWPPGVRVLAAPVFDDAAFYAACRRVLEPGGVMSVNLFGRDARFAHSLGAIVAELAVARQFAGVERLLHVGLAVATILVVISIALLATVELLRRRSERLRGVTPH